MRNFTPQTETQLLKQFGTEPMIVASVDWVEDGNITFYSDRKIAGQAVEGRILDISILDNVFVLEDNSDSKQISITLDDSDGVLKNIINNNDIHGRSVSISHWDASTPLPDVAILFTGTINSPIIWDEGDRTLKFTILSKIEDAEYGFSLDESIGIPDQPLALQGKAWPLCFGTVTNVPALRLVDRVEGILESPVGIRDFTLVPKLNYLTNCGKCITCRSGSTFNLTDNTSSSNFAPCGNCNRRVCVAVRKLELQIISQTNLQFTTLKITSAGRFPQGQIINLKIDGALFIGFFDGTTADPSSDFIVTRREHAKFSEIGSTTATSVATTINNEVNVLIDTKCGAVKRDLVDINRICDGISLDTDGLPQDQARGVSDFWRVVNAWPSAGFQFIDAGATVKLVTAADVAYVCNLVTSTSIIKVKARKKIGQATRLIDVPDSFWSTRTVDFGTYQTTEIVFPKLLSDISKEWEDDIFVTLKSSEGPLITDILEFLINKYTTFTINRASFDSVKLDLAGWEANFALLDRGNILNLLRDIAFQARCAIYITNGEIFVQFLAKRPTPVDLILESDVENNSLSLEHTSTEDLVTKFVAKWTNDYAQKESIKTVLRWNVGKYGLKEQEFDFFIYDDEELVRTASTFWLLRKSQIWRRLKFKTAIHKLQLETFDNIEVRFNDFSSDDILAHIQGASYDSNDFSISFDCWTPVRSGEQTEYDFAFPDDVDVETIFPSLDDIESGRFDITAPGALTFAPISDLVHPLSGNTRCDNITLLTDVKSLGCYNVRFGGLANKKDRTRNKADQDTPTGEPVLCDIAQSDVISDGGTILGDGAFTGPGSDVLDSEGNVIGQRVEDTNITVEFTRAELFPPGTECPDEPHDEDSDKLEEHGDPADALDTEDPDNDPANDGCNPPVCPTPSPCDVELEDTSECVAQVGVSILFYGIKLIGQAIVTRVDIDQYCFNSDQAATDFFNKMVIIDQAQPKPQLGDTQISMSQLDLLLSGGRPPCNDLGNIREDAAMIQYRQFGPLTLLKFGVPLCNKEPGGGVLESPEIDPCVPPTYLE